ncbi:hypothetical protein GGQ85_003684 [Nitrobacter vulgaris]|jgi:hypothetical protein|nr:hypothetical protein [Nitrobacter vulgaris]
MAAAAITPVVPYCVSQGLPLKPLMAAALTIKSNCLADHSAEMIADPARIRLYTYKLW